jgi:DNA ligase 1
MAAEPNMRPFTETADAVAATTKKLEKVRLVSELLKALPLEDAAHAAVFLTGSAFPRRDERVLGVGGAQLANLVAELAGRHRASLGEAYRRHGDLGDMAEDLLGEREKKGDGEDSRASGISLGELASAFERLPALRVQNQKVAMLREIFSRATPSEVKYIIKIITGDLRIGLKESLVEEALAKAFERPIEEVRRANMLTGDIGEALRLAAAGTLSSAAVQLFHPIGFMLASPVDTPGEVFSDEATAMYVEEKYDGIRAQVHKGASGVKIFSRTLDEVLEFPELRPAIAGLPGELILDGEILGWHGEQPLPFTELQKRLGRKQMDLWLPLDIPVRFVAFDLLYQDGALLLDEPLAERRKRLEKIFADQSEGLLRLAAANELNSAESIESAFRASLAAGHEGIVAKSPGSPYTPGRRGRFWFKLKQPFATLDVVVTAVEYGHGKRHHVLSDYTFAVRDGEQLLNIGKAYSGLTDTEISDYTKYFMEHTLEDHGFRRTVEPNVVIEVAFNNIQRSKRHASGYALRFPRILRLRPDKSAKEIDTLDRVTELYAKQITLPRHGEARS